MKILVDFRLAKFSIDRGIGRYTFGLLDTLQRRRPEIKIDLLVDRGVDLDIRYSQVYADSLKGFSAEFYDIFFMPQYFAYEWQEVPNLLDRVLPPDLIRICAQIVGVGHDLIPMLFRDLYFKSEGAKHAAKIGCEIARLSSHTFANSETTRSDFIRHAGVHPQQITNIFGGVNDNIWNPSRQNKHSIKTNNVVYVGGDDFRKNLDGCINGFAAFKKRSGTSSIKLVIACDIRDSTKKHLLKSAKSSGIDIRNDLEITGYLPDDELVKLVSTARASIFPSLYEGLGLPILESYAVATPVFASNVSSCAEITPHECQFDPNFPESIADAFFLIERNEKLLRKSVEFGKQVLERCNWDVATKKVENVLDRLVSEQPLDRKINNPIAVISILPPDQSGVAIQSAKTFTTRTDIFHLFSNFGSAENLESFKQNILVSGGSPANVFHNLAYKNALEKFNYRSTVFVLGNSPHHISTLRMALDWTGSSSKRFLYLHEASLDGLWVSYFDGRMDRLKNIFEFFYGASEVLSACEPWDLARNGFFGIWPLIATSGITDIIVNSDLARRLVDRDIGHRTHVRIHVAFHAVESRPAVEPIQVKQGEELLVGHFGIPSTSKGVPKLISAVRLMNETRPVRLLLAGWELNGYIWDQIAERDRQFISFYDSPSDQSLIDLMNAVDVAVQLREFTRGESSGIIHQLMALGIPTIATIGIMDRAFKEALHEVDRNVSPSALADAIFAASTKRSNTSEWNQYSHQSLADHIASIAT